MNWGFWALLALIGGGLIYLRRAEHAALKRGPWRLAQTLGVIFVAVLVVVAMAYGLNQCTSHGPI